MAEDPLTRDTGTRLELSASTRPSILPVRALGLAFAWAALSGSAAPDGPGEPPALVVVVVVDQLRADLLERYDCLFTGGIRRLVDEGYGFTNATHRHAVTESAPGHATLVTGVHPSRHGIVANTWTETRDGVARPVQAVSDSVSPVPGLPDVAGRSPRNLLRGGLPDWIHDHDPRTRIVSVSRKDVAAVVLGGVTGGHVYWMAPSAAAFVTSTFYRDTLPEWVARFNRERAPVLLGDSAWESTIPTGAEILARRADFEYAGDGVNVTLPHRFQGAGSGRSPETFNRWVADTPMPDRATAELARLALEELDLGRRGAPDYLAISFSQTDIIGHTYGPLSLQQLDNLLRLDRILGRLLDFLDEHVGPGRWILAFSGDHGVLDVPEYLQERGLPGRRVTRAELRSIRDTARVARSGAHSGDEVARRVVEAVGALDFIATAIHGPPMVSPADSFPALFANSYHPDRAAGPLSGYDVQLRQSEGTLMSYRSGRGTGHGSAYHYDRHVPLIFLGAGVDPGSSAEPVETVDLAPTLARLARIPMPPDLDGRPLLP